jgi:hypothetical protein
MLNNHTPIPDSDEVASKGIFVETAFSTAEVDAAICAETGAAMPRNTCLFLDEPKAPEDPPR